MPRDTLSARLERERAEHAHALEALEGELSRAEADLTQARLENARLEAIFAVLRASLDQAGKAG